MDNKKINLRIISIILTFSLILTSLPISVAAETQTEAEQPVVETTDTTKEQEATIIEEVEEKREPNVKHFLLSDGTYTAAVYDEDVHILEEDGSYSEIDNSLVDDGTELKAKNGKNDIKLSNNTNSSKLVKMKIGDYKLSWNFEGINKTKSAKIKNKETKELTGDEKHLTVTNTKGYAYFENAFDNVDLEYIIGTNSVKENIVLKQKGAKSTYVVNYNIDKLTAVQIDSKTITLYDGENPVFTLSAPIMTDSAKQSSNDLALTIVEQKNKKLTVKLSADDEWLNSDERVYPVTLDPVAVFEYIDTAIQGTNSPILYKYSYSNTNITESSPGTLFVGYSAGNSSMQTTCSAIKLKKLPTLSSGDMVYYASLELYLNDFQYDSTTINNFINVDLHEITSAWSGFNASTIFVKGNAPVSNSTVVDYQKASVSLEDEFSSWDITALVKKWYNGEANNGVVLKATNTVADHDNIAWYATPENAGADHPERAPTFIIQYLNHKGLEDYWSFTDFAAGTGSAYVNNYTGNFIYSAPIISTTSENMPASIALTYNSLQDDHFPNSICGAGFRTNYDIKLSYLTPGVGLNDKLQELGYYYTLEDADGTVHYMKSESNSAGGTHKDEDGLGWTLKYSSTGAPYTLTDKDNNKMTFNSRGRLIGIYNNQSSDSITLTYNSTGYILQKVTDGSGKTLTFTRNQNNAILNIADEFGRKVYFSYNDDALEKITYYDGTVLNMAYDSDYKLIEIVAPDDTAIGISYISSGEPNERYRVSQVTEYSTKNANGVRTSQNSLTFAYNKDNTTNITNSLDETTTYVFDNAGRQISAYSDEYGASSSSWQTVTNKVNTNKDARYENNKLLAQHSAEKLTANHIWNNNFEANVLAGMTNTTNDGTNHYVITTEDKYYGSQSVKVNHTTASISDDITQTVSNLSGGIYTYSAYVKASNVAGNGGGYIKATYTDTSGNTKTVKSEYIKTTDDWQRINVKLLNVAMGSINITLGFENATGTVYFDCLQLEEGYLDDYNLAENSVFLRGNNWYSGAIYSIGTPTAGAPSYLTKSVKIYGDGLNYKHIAHTSYIGQSANNLAINISVYARANSVNTQYDSTRYFGVKYTIFYTDNTSQSGGQQFNTHSDAWQYWSILAMPTEANKSKTINKITVYLTYNNNRNYAEWSGLSVKVDKTASTFSYDSKGNPISANTAGGLEGTSNFDSTTNRLLSSSDEIDGNYTYTYYDNAEATKYRLKSATQTGLNQKFNYEYNSHGQVTKVTQANAGSTTGTIYQSITNYSTDGSKLLSAESVSGSTTNYTYDTYDRASTVTTNGVAVNYAYDTGNRVTSINALRDSANANSAVTNSYGYDDAGRLSTITHNNFNYNIEYDNFGRQYAVKVGDQYLADYQYDDYGRLVATWYANGSDATIVYDSKGRVSTQRTGSRKVTAYRYNEAGLVANIDLRLPSANIMTYLEYDLLGRLINAHKNIYNYGDVYYNYGYNTKNQLVSAKYKINGVTHGADFAYTDWNIGTDTTFSNGVKVKKTLNHLAAPSSKMVTNTSNQGLKVSYTYKEDSTRNYGLVESYRYSVGTIADATNNTLSNAVNDSLYTYTYDANGNITEIKCDGSLMYRYHYDDLGQLIRADECEANQTLVMEYDEGGNITSIKEYNYCSIDEDNLFNTRTYTYGNGNWKDLLTAYNGNTITYDEIGNPLVYKNGEEFIWYARELRTINKGTQTITNHYNEDGIRVKKIVADSADGSTKTIHYIVDGDQIVAIHDGNNLSRFYYDVDGVRTAMEYNGNMYYYQYNLQGDVTGLYDSNFDKVVYYLYDSWGKLLEYGGSMADTVGTANPFRYRGYFYDEETGFYYVSSRYYDPVVGRWINADELIDNGAGILGYNMYAYCINNPVNMIDIDGYSPKYINGQHDNYKIDGKKMKNISFGIGNIAANGCGVIAAYNVLLSRSSKVKFNNVKNGIIWRGGLNVGGLLGANPLALVKYMKSKFWRVYTAGPITYLWGIKAELSESVIVLYKNAKSLSMHYVAGIGSGNRGVGGSFRFYNTGYSDIDGKKMSIWTFIDKIKSKGNTPMYFIGVNGKRGRW